MKKRWREYSRGQALIMVTFALIAMMGLLGLAVDLGWSFFVRKSARSAADSAALAAVIEGMRRLGGSGAFTCDDGTLACRPAAPAGTTCTGDLAGTNLENACIYAHQNGFQSGGHNNRQTVTVQADVPGIGCVQPNCVPTAPGVTAFYWVTVRVTETVPQLFSAVLGNPTGTVQARATAVITDSTVRGALILLNRENDENPVQNYKGVNFDGGGGPNVTAPAGILLASQCNGGAGCNGNYAGTLGGGAGARVTADFTYVRGVGQACAGNLPCGTGGSVWSVPPSPGEIGSPWFEDPMRGKGQPPLNKLPLDPKAIDGGVLIGGPTAASAKIIECGNYFATQTDKKTGVVTATGGPITLSGSGGNNYFTFSPAGCPGGSTFGDWVFFGGLRTSGGAAVVEMVPGRYVFAGQNGGPTGELFHIDNGTVLKDQTTGAVQNDAGQLLIFTDWNYPGNYKEPLTALKTQTDSLPQYVKDAAGLFQFGQSGLKMGSNDSSTITLHGLNPKEILPSNPLDPFTPVVMWQDQRNSRVLYDDHGNVVGDVNTAFPTVNDPRRIMNLGAGVNVHLFGAVYQPRGAWVELQGMGGGGAGYIGPLQIVTGGLKMLGGPRLTLLSTSEPIVRRVVALVE
jgi:hypothetical protein